MRSWFFVICTFLASAVSAQEMLYLSADGGQFAYKLNRHGAVLTSEEPVITNTNKSPALAPGQMLYLGSYCDAFSRMYGEGSWSRLSGGFIVAFSDLRVAFPGQTIDVVPSDECRS